MSFTGRLFAAIVPGVMVDKVAQRSFVARGRVSAFVLAITIFATAAPVFADFWYEHYARAESALAARDYKRAVEQLQEALERRGDSGRRVRSYGMNVIDYFPYLKLGIAYYNLGQADAALKAFDTEERLGAVQGADDAFAELKRFKKLATDALSASPAVDRARIEEIVRTSLQQARSLETEGRLQDAMDALAKAIAVDPGNQTAEAAMARVRGVLARQLQERENETRANELLSRGRDLLDKGQAGEASSLFREVLTLKPSKEVADLLARAQEKLRSTLPTPPIGVSSGITERLATIRNLASQGRLTDALADLEAVLAVNPGNSEVMKLQRELFARKRESDAKDAVGKALVDAEQAFTEGRFEASLAAANRALALESGNSAALATIKKAYRAISRRLLGPSGAGKLPPAIRFADFREDLADGIRAQRLRRPDFQLSGVVIDASPVSIVMRDSNEQPIAVKITSQQLGDVVLTEFRLDHVLMPGTSVFRVTATDEAHLSSTSEYLAIYLRPLHRSPLVWLALLALPVAAAAGIVFMRIRRRHDLQRRRYNPYVAGAPVLDGGLFFGRDELIERVLQTIHNNSLLLYGERRIGKTSIQHHLKRRLLDLEDPEYQFYPVLIDLQGVPGERFFATLGEEITSELKSNLDGLEWSGKIGGGAAYGYRELVEDLRDVLRVLSAKTVKRVKIVLLLDEVDELNDYDPRINQKLRSLFMKGFAENLVAVVSGVEIRKQWEKEGSPWYNFFEEVEVKAISREDARRLIEGPIKAVFNLEKGVVDRIIEKSGCKPYLIQKLCIALVNRLHQNKRRTITLADVDAAGNGAEK